MIVDLSFSLFLYWKNWSPLYGQIFGIIKAKLRSLAKSKIFSDEEHFSAITGYLMTAWDQKTSQNIISALISINNVSKRCGSL